MAKSPKTQPPILKDIQDLPMVKIYLEHADEFTRRYGYTEHGFRHADLVSRICYNILSRTSFPTRTAEVGEVAGYLHDIGNMVSRQGHEQIGAMLAQEIMQGASFDVAETALVMNAIGNHEEEYGWIVSEVGAALVIADKSDVHKTRVRNPDPTTFDIHDRVNYAAKRSFLRVDEKKKLLTLEIDIDTEVSQVMEYFEIFLSRMIMCRRAAEYLSCTFSLVINNTKLL